MKAKGPILLLITAILWGFAFVAQTTASSDIGPFTFNASRNIIGAVFLTGVIAMRKRLGHDEAPQLGSDGNASGYTRKALVIAGVTCGVVLFAASYLQQAGITAYPAGAAASGRSGFVTATYMIMVALMGVVVGKKTQPIVFVAVAVSMLGMYLLCVPNGLGSIYVGDWLVLASALGYALHIIVIDRFTRIDGVRLSRVQLMTSAAIALVCALAFEHPDPAAIASALVTILYAGICSDGIAYTFQIIAEDDRPHRRVHPDEPRVGVRRDRRLAHLVGEPERGRAARLRPRVRGGHARPGAPVRRELAAQTCGTLQLGARAGLCARKGSSADALV